MRQTKKQPTIAKTGDDYIDRSKAYVAAHDGKWIVLSRRDPAQAQQRRAWLTYFAWLDVQTTPRRYRASAWEPLEYLQVPAEWPLEFDDRAPAAPPPKPPEPPVSPERRKEIANQLRALAASFELRQKRPPAWWEATPAQAMRRLEELRAEYAANPIGAAAALQAANNEIDEIGEGEI